MGHIRKAQAKAFVIGPDERIVSLQIDVIGQHDQSTLFIFQIDATGSVRKNDGAYIHPSKHPHGKGDIFDRVTFIQMYASLHGGDRDIGCLTNHHLTGVSDGRRAWETWNLGVRSARRIGQFVGETTESGAEHEPDLRSKRGAREQELGRRVGVSEFVVRSHPGSGHFTRCRFKTHDLWREFAKSESRACQDSC